MNEPVETVNIGIFSIKNNKSVKTNKQVIIRLRQSHKQINELII